MRKVCRFPFDASQNLSATFALSYAKLKIFYRVSVPVRDVARIFYAFFYCERRRRMV